MTKTRATKKTEPEENGKTASRIDEDPIKVFILQKNLLKSSNETTEIEFVKLRNPATEKLSYYAIDKETKIFYQLLQFNEPNRSFFIDDMVSSDGKIQITQPLDIKLLYLYYIRKFASQKAVSIDQIEDPESPASIDFLSKYIDKKELEKICNIKDYSDELFFVKYNEEKALAWLSLVTKKIARNIKEKKIHTGGSGAQSANFEKSSFLEENVNDEKILTYSWGLIGTFLTEDLHLELAKYMKIIIPTPKSVKEEPNKKNSKKRKPLEDIDDDANNKKVKVEDISSPEATQKPKEKVPTIKEKQLAKAASGTKSIMSFFKK